MILFLSCLLMFPGEADPSQDKLIAALNGKVPSLMKDAHVPGLSMVLIRDRRIAWQGCYGLRSAGKPGRVNPETVFEAASMSKPLFTYAAMTLVDAGRLNLDRALDSYLPSPYLPDQPRAGRITARMVFLHRTGLPNWRKGGSRSGGPLTLICEPDTRFTYSGEGYVYLQAAVARITGQPMHDWITGGWLKPMGMTRSSYAWRPDFKANFAGGHDKNGRLKEKRRFFSKANSAYSLYTTPSDYARFLLAMIRPGKSSPYTPSNAALSLMTTLQVLPEDGKPRTRRALGWVIEPDPRGGEWITHSGSNGTGFRCNSRIHKQRGDGSVIMTNADGGRALWEAILNLLDA